MRVYPSRTEAEAARSAFAAGCRAPLAALGLAAGLAAAALSGRAAAAEMPHRTTASAFGAPVNLYAPHADVYAPYHGDRQLHPWHVQGRVWLLAGEPGESNVAVQIGNQGVLVVDTGTRAMAPELLAQIRRLAQRHAGDQKAIRFVVDTNGLCDHIGGNKVIAEAGSTIVGGAGGGGRLAPGNASRGSTGVVPGATVIAHLHVLTHLVAERAACGSESQALWPTDTETFRLFNMHFNGEAVRLYHPQHANTDGQLMVQFRRSDVIAAGDVFDMKSYPIIDIAQGGTIDGELVALNKLIDMAVPADKQEGGTMIIPGHGRLGDQSDVVHYTDMLTIIRNRVQLYKDQGKTLEQVLALGPSSDYDGRWGAASGPWTTRDFIVAVYRTLPAKGPVFSMRTVTLVPATAAVSGGSTF